MRCVHYPRHSSVLLKPGWALSEYFFGRASSEHKINLARFRMLSHLSRSCNLCSHYLIGARYSHVPVKSLSSRLQMSMGFLQSISHATFKFSVFVSLFAHNSLTNGQMCQKAERDQTSWREESLEGEKGLETNLAPAGACLSAFVGQKNR